MKAKIKIKGKFKSVIADFSDCKNLIEVRSWLNGCKGTMINIGNEIIIPISLIRQVKSLNSEAGK